MNPINRAGAVLLALGLAVGVPACGSDPEVCADVETLKADLDQLADVRIEPGGLAEFSTDLEQVESDVRALADSAASEYDTEVEGVRTSTQALRDSVTQAVQDPSGAALTQVSADFGTFTQSVDDLRAAVADTC